MPFWKRDNVEQAEAEPTGGGDLTDWPNMIDPVTRSQLLDFVQRRSRAMKDEQRDFPARLAEWESTISARLTERIPQMVELLRKSRHGILALGSTADDYIRGREPVKEIFEGLFPPEQPATHGLWGKQFDPAIAYLESLEGEELTADHRMILQRLGCFHF